MSDRKTNNDWRKERNALQSRCHALASDYDALAAENDKLRELVREARNLVGTISSYDNDLLEMKYDWLKRATVQPSAPCEECGGTGVLERKEDSAPMECWACSPQPAKERT